MTAPPGTGEPAESGAPVDPGGGAETDGRPTSGIEPPLDDRVERQVERMADGRRITYYAWRADEGRDDPAGGGAADDPAGGAAGPERPPAAAGER